MALPNLRTIFASARSSEEERQLSRATFYKFSAFVASVLVISLIASRNAKDLVPKAAKAVAGR
ncbi:hypothetical protein CC85DRAFT_68259 [Cutaneotrichosporon oleaginosum]|uniref:Uncharacterized protein n=1 Tax=Cutaneotrichosporon oleaginosum TaxID=879819 RepID=A0A0J0XPT0_9TREE|nr:uncharacterized protein CC85DRAFT_68259 [Cutaneotrichosporon oleaginosum]KLT43125.1 hypothetical protein CC85DRAFT_68259 [Cutaneotrichosporon oleaginosum]TXT10052.1 hypothetical protein COLE_03986 [Cutaneotrichosporon oleaginosum]